MVATVQNLVATATCRGEMCPLKYCDNWCWAVTGENGGASALAQWRVFESEDYIGTEFNVIPDLKNVSSFRVLGCSY